MSNRSNAFNKLKRSLTQSPATRPAQTPPWPSSPVPLDGGPRRPERNFADPRQLPGLERMTASDGLTVVMAPVRHFLGADAAPTQVLPPIQAAQSVENLAATQILAPAPVDAPPSARHVDPARRYYEQTFVEDDGMEPRTRGQHVLAELKAFPDPAQELAAVAQRVISDLSGPDTAAKDPARRASVRMFRHARDMARARVARCDRDDARLDAADARIKAFAQRWAHDDAHWDKVAAVLNAKENATGAGQIAVAYADGGTEVALGMVTQVKDLIVQRALAGSAVTR